MKIGISEAFRKYLAKLKNVNWSVSSWANEHTLVLSLWRHHELKGKPSDVLAFGDRFDRWSGPGNSEFCANVARAFEIGANLRVAIARTLDSDRVQRGKDASKISKTFAGREDLIGRVAEIDVESYVMEFRKTVA
jgi:hypothetical protein